MTLLAALIALVLEMQLTDPGRYRPTERLEDAMRRLRGLFQGSDFFMGWPGVLLTLALVPLAVGIVTDWLRGDGFIRNLLLLVFSLVILLWCLRVRDLWDRVRAYLALHDDADEAVLRGHARAILGREPEGGRASWPDQIMVTLLTQATDRLFGPLFWFVMLGPMGAVLFASAVLLRDQTDAEEAGEDANRHQTFRHAARMAYRFLAWLPLRLLVTAFSLVGSFTDTLEGWRAHELRCLDVVKDAQAALVVCAGYGALSMDPPWSRSEDAPMAHGDEVKAIAGLLQRAFLVWMAAIFVLWAIGLLP